MSTYFYDLKAPMGWWKRNCFGRFAYAIPYRCKLGCVVHDVPSLMIEKSAFKAIYSFSVAVT